MSLIFLRFLPLTVSFFYNYFYRMFFITGQFLRCCCESRDHYFVWTYRSVYTSTLYTYKHYMYFCLKNVSVARLYWSVNRNEWPKYNVKKVIDFPVPSRYVTDQTLSGREFFNYSRPERVWSVTSRLWTGKSITFYYSVCYQTEVPFLFELIPYRKSAPLINQQSSSDMFEHLNLIT